MTITEVPTLTPGLWAIEPAHTEIGFTVRHLGLSKVRGRFNSFSGSVQVGDPIDASVIEAEIDLASVDTNNEQRDEHLRSTDFFDTQTHPKMTFVSTRIVDNGGTGSIDGHLTINGFTRAVELDAEFFGVGIDPFDITRAGFSASTVISRKDFGIDFNVPLDAGKVLVGDKITIELDVQLVPAG
jgi:polyisoprenoid-binding protein YceI